MLHSTSFGTISRCCDGMLIMQDVIISILFISTIIDYWINQSTHLVQLDAIAMNDSWADGRLVLVLQIQLASAPHRPMTQCWCL